MRDSKMLINRGKYLFQMWAIAVVALTILAYFPAIKADYIWDDDSYVTENQTLRSWEGLRAIWTERGAVPQYYPLVHSTFWVEYQLWGLNPRGYHTVNIVLHALNAILVGLVLLELQVPWFYLIATVFAVHPVHVESVAWITERKNVLSGLFYLSSLLIYLRCFPYSRSPAISVGQSGKDDPPTHMVQKWSAYSLALLLYGAALLSKTVSCTLPAIIACLIWWKNEKTSVRNYLPLVPFFIIGAVLSVNTIWMEKNHVGAQGSEWSFSFVERGIIAGRAWWFYVEKLVVPTKLTFIYPRWTINAGEMWQYIYLVAGLVLLAALWKLRHKIGKGPLVALGFFTITLLPALGFISFYPMLFSFVADHFQYLASLGVLTLVIAGGFSWLEKIAGEKARYPLLIAGVGMVLALASLTWRQSQIYQGKESLWADTLAKNPGAWVGHNNLGVYLEGQGRYSEAIPHFQAAIQLRPNDTEFYCNLANAFARTGQLDLAISEYRKAISVQSDCAEAYINLGILYKKRGETEKSLATLLELVRVVPEYAGAFANLGVVYYELGRYQEASAAYGKAIILNPGEAGVYLNLGSTLEKMGKPTEAIAAYRQALTLNPKFGEAYNNLGLLYLHTRKEDEAIKLLEKAMAICPLQPMPYYNCGLAYLKRGDTGQAANLFEKAATLDPAYAPAWGALAQTALARGQIAQASEYADQASRLGLTDFELTRKLREAKSGYRNGGLK